MPGASPEIVVDEPVPEIAPGLITQLPVGNPLSNTLPVAEVQVVWVMVPMFGAEGVIGCVLIVMLVGDDEQPAELVTE